MLAVDSGGGGPALPVMPAVNSGGTLSRNLSRNLNLSSNQTTATAVQRVVHGHPGHQPVLRQGQDIVFVGDRVLFEGRRGLDPMPKRR